MSSFTKHLMIIFGFILGLILIVSLSIVQDNKYDVLLFQTAINNKCDVVADNAKVIITCIDPKIEAKLNKLIK